MSAGKSKPYTNFAAIYDQTMTSVDYEAWADYVEDLLAHFNCRPQHIIDLACGTGSSTLPFAQRGYRICGLDLSPAMICEARLKSERAGLAVPFIEGNLCSLTLAESYDLALLFQDGLNYLTDDQQLLKAFSGIKKSLKKGGVFIFDLTRPKLRPAPRDNELNWADLDDFTLIWESNYCREQELWTVQMTVFQKQGSDLYSKYQETHQEKDHDPEQVKVLLEQAGFTPLALFRSFSFNPPGAEDAKLTFVAAR